jgi:hypothetical protein
MRTRIVQSEPARQTPGALRSPRRASCLAVAALGTLLATAPGLAQGPGNDIRAELMFQAQVPRYIVQIRNVGPTIPPHVRGQYTLVIPAGIQIVSWTLNGMSCAPSPPVIGPASIACGLTLSSAWAAGTILSNQLFVAKLPVGVVRPKVCVRAQLLVAKPPSTALAPAPETNTANNSLCV